MTDCLHTLAFNCTTDQDQLLQLADIFSRVDLIPNGSTSGRTDVVGGPTLEACASLLKSLEVIQVRYIKGVKQRFDGGGGTQDV